MASRAQQQLLGHIFTVSGHWSLVTGIRERGTTGNSSAAVSLVQARLHPSSEKSSWIYSGTTGNRSQQLTGSSRSGDTDVVGNVQEDSEMGHQIGDPMLLT
jgi:hypothetical protein